MGNLFNKENENLEKILHGSVLGLERQDKPLITMELNCIEMDKKISIKYIPFYFFRSMSTISQINNIKLLIVTDIKLHCYLCTVSIAYNALLITVVCVCL